MNWLQVLEEKLLEIEKSVGNWVWKFSELRFYHFCKYPLPQFNLIFFLSENLPDGGGDTEYPDLPEGHFCENGENSYAKCSTSCFNDESKFRTEITIRKAQHAEWDLKKIEKTFNETYACWKSKHQGFRRYFIQNSTLRSWKQPAR